jgi:hypothetical protein
MPKLLGIKNVEQIKKEITNFFSVNEDARFVRRLDIIALICNEHPRQPFSVGCIDSISQASRA